MVGEFEELTKLLRVELTAVHQQFFHMLALRQWKNKSLLARITEVDNEDFKNAMQIIDLLVSQGHKISLPSQRISPGWDCASIPQSELRMENELVALLENVQVDDPAALARVKRAKAPRSSYREWLTEQISKSTSEIEQPVTTRPIAEFLGHLIALVEQPMLHAFFHLRSGNESRADNDWRLSGAAMLYGTALVRRGALINNMLSPSTSPPVRLTPDSEKAFQMDMALVRRCAELGRDAAEAAEDETTGRLCQTIADDCNLIAEMKSDGIFPATFGRSSVFENFRATCDKHLG